MSYESALARSKELERSESIRHYTALTASTERRIEGYEKKLESAGPSGREYLLDRIKTYENEATSLRRHLDRLRG